MIGRGCNPTTKGFIVAGFDLNRLVKDLDLNDLAAAVNRLLNSKTKPGDRPAGALNQVAELADMAATLLRQGDSMMKAWLAKAPAGAQSVDEAVALGLVEFVETAMKAAEAAGQPLTLVAPDGTLVTVKPGQSATEVAKAWVEARAARPAS